MTRLKLVARVFVFIALIGALYLLQPLVPQESIDRLSTAEDQIAEGNLNGRVDIWREGFNIFKDHTVFGVGSFAFRSAATRAENVAHNSFLNVLVEVGIVGFTIFVLIIAVSIYEALRHQDPYLRLLWLTLLVVLAIGAFSLNWAHRKQAWLIPSLVVVSAGLNIQSSKSAQLNLRQKKDKSPRKTQLPQSPFVSGQLRKSKHNNGFLQTRYLTQTTQSKDPPNSVGS